MEIDYTHQLDSIVSALSNKLPEWLVALVSALLGFLAALSLESVKRWRTQHGVKRMLYREITFNHAYLWSLKAKLDGVESTDLSTRSFCRELSFESYHYSKNSLDIYTSLDEYMYFEFAYRKFEDLTKPNSTFEGTPYFIDPKVLIAQALEVVDRFLRENVFDIKLVEEVCPAYLKGHFQELAYRVPAD